MAAKPVVLVEEDDRVQSDLVMEIINETGLYEAVAAYDGEHALEVLKSYQRGFNFLSNGVSCILLDWQMPKMNGQALIRDQKSTRLNSSHVKNSYAVFCLKNK